MTVSKAIIDWLKEFNPEEYWKMQNINTDLMQHDVDYVLVKEPTRNVKKFISGTQVITEHYQFRARLSAYTNMDAVDNDAWMEALSEWIEERGREKVYPQLSVGEVQDIGISTPYYMGRNENNEAIYQLTIYIRYMKKGE